MDDLSTVAIFSSTVSNSDTWPIQIQAPVDNQGLARRKAEEFKRFEKKLRQQELRLNRGYGKRR